MGSSFDRLKQLIHKTTPDTIAPKTSADIEAEVTRAVENMTTTAVANVSETAGDYITTAGDWTTMGGIGGSVVNTTGVTYTIPAPGYTMGTSYIVGGGGGYGGGGFTFTTPPKTNIIAYNDSKGKEIVRLNLDGSVTWSQDMPVDEAAENFARALSIGAEVSAGLTQKVKLKMRDSVFEDLINIAKEKGSLTAEDLTYLLEASKIVEKLKGAKD